MAARQANQRKTPSPRRQPANTHVEASQFLSADDALALLKTSKPTLYRWLRAGQIKGVKIGRQWRFHRKDVERFLAGQQPEVTLNADIKPVIERLKDQLGTLDKSTRTDPEANDVGIAADLLIRLAQAMRASDIHVEPLLLGAERCGVVRFRVDGVLQEVARFNLQLVNPLVDQFKGMAGCNVSDNVHPQDGRILLDVAGKRLDLRACFIPAVFGQAATLRLLDPDAVCLSLDRLGHRPEDRRRLDQALASPWGLIFVTGPTGCGKTTVLYACLHAITKPTVKILSVEDPVEFALPGVTQVQVRLQHGLTFPAALRAFLRCDPDVILVGETRDAESAHICAQAALTGHLVLSTLHTEDAAAALQRLRDIGLPHFLVASAVRLISAQRLVRVLCPHCKRPATPTASHVAAIQAAIGASQPLDAADAQFHEAVGCPKCSRTGYRGRTLIAEMLVMSPGIGEAMRRGAAPSELRTIAMMEGMTPMAFDGYRLACEGRTTLEEVLRVMPPG